MPLNVSGDYSVTLINSVGCDSIVNLNLTVTTTSALGCTDSLACNYDPLVTIDDGSCIFISSPVVDLTVGQWIMENDYDCDSLTPSSVTWYVEYSLDGTMIYSTDSLFAVYATSNWSLCGSNYIETDGGYWWTGTYSNGSFIGSMGTVGGCWFMYPNLTYPQQTYVPDDNFEAYLEANGMGNGIANDDFVTTANISGVTNLDVYSLNISDLTGIEDFLL